MLYQTTKPLQAHCRLCGTWYLQRVAVLFGTLAARELARRSSAPAALANTGAKGNYHTAGGMNNTAHSRRLTESRWKIHKGRCVFAPAGAW